MAFFNRCKEKALALIKAHATARKVAARMPGRETINDGWHHRCVLPAGLVNMMNSLKQINDVLYAFFLFLSLFYRLNTAVPISLPPLSPAPPALSPAPSALKTSYKCETGGKSQNHRNISQYLKDCMKVQYFYVNMLKILSQLNLNNLPQLSSETFKNRRRQALAKRKSPVRTFTGKPGHLQRRRLRAGTTGLSPAPVAEPPLALTLFLKSYTKCSIRGFCFCSQQKYYKTHKFEKCY